MTKLTLPEYLLLEAVAQDAFRQGAEAMREQAAARFDCLCSASHRELLRLTYGKPECPNSSECGAVKANAIRALPLPEDRG